MNVKHPLRPLAWLFLALISTVEASEGCPETNDWMTAAPALSMPVKPRPCEIVDQTPPDFSWPDQGSAGYEFELRDVAGKIRKEITDRNWVLLTSALAPGAYQWRVRPMQSSAANFSVWRGFTVAEDAVLLLVPAPDALRAQASAKPHPRAFPQGAAHVEMLAALAGPRRVMWEKYRQSVLQNLNAKAYSDSAGLADATADRKRYSIQLQSAKKSADAEVDRLLNIAFVGMVREDPVYLDQAKKLLLRLANWNARGATGVNHHQVAGRMVWTLALAYDWLYPRLTPGERKQVLQSITLRMDDLLREFGVRPKGKLDKMPFNSHGWVALGEMAAAASLLVGDDPRADAWFDSTVRPFMFLLSPWGGHDGGWGNGIAYGVWDALSLVTPIDILHYTTGVDLWRKGWSRHLAEHLLYFMPPGQTSAQFGDGAEKPWTAGDVGDLAKAYALRSPTYLSAWYARQVQGRRAEDFKQLFAPVVKEIDLTAPPDLPDAANFQTVGWAAMHSSLAQRAKTSVYFKSSPYGSFNHSHADQNSFIIAARGRQLAIDSGYYDYRGSEHGVQWYMQTRAHNAITFDGGQGQAVNDRAAAGKIIRFTHTPAYDIVTGDATASYHGSLTKAVRSLVYLRPNTLLVYDALAAAQPRHWEWNIHTLNRFGELEAGHFRTEVDGVSMCIDVLHPVRTEFTQSDAFTAAPLSRSENPAEVFPKQWHGILKPAAASAEMRYLVALRIDCAPAEITVVQTDEGAYSVRVNGLNLLFLENGQVISR